MRRYASHRIERGLPGGDLAIVLRFFTGLGAELRADLLEGCELVSIRKGEKPTQHVLPFGRVTSAVCDDRLLSSGPPVARKPASPNSLA